MAIAAGAHTGWAVNNATTQVVTLPTHAAGNLIIVIAAAKGTSGAALNPDITSPAGTWTRFASAADGVVNSGVGTGSVNQTLCYLIATSGAETNPTVSWNTTSAPGIACALVFTKAAGETWVAPTQDQSTLAGGTSISNTMADPGITAGDVGLCVITQADDSALTVPTWTATGLTLAAAVVFPTTPIADPTSNDIAGTAAYRIVTAGTASTGPTVTATSAAAETGVVGFFRLRVLAAGQVPYVSPYRQIASY